MVLAADAVPFEPPDDPAAFTELAMRSQRPFLFFLFLAVSLAAAPAQAWNAHGHRTIARLAVDGLPTDMPSWLKEADTVARIAEQACEPDRWRSTKRMVIGHELNTEHYLDVEDLADFGLSLRTIPRQRYEYVKKMVLAKQAAPEKFKSYDPMKDLDKSKEWPGFLPYAVDEHFALLQSSFNTLRVLEAVEASDAPGKGTRAATIKQERENIIHEMGILAHLIGDTAQPLHMTRHHHGWVGDNPKGYTTDNGFHSFIDGKILEIHGFNAENLRPRLTFQRHINPADPWDDVLSYMDRSFAKVEPLYQLQKDGTLTQDKGKEFIAGCLADASETLSALYTAAWEASKLNNNDVSNFIKYDERKANPTSTNPTNPAKPTETPTNPK